MSLAVLQAHFFAVLRGDEAAGDVFTGTPELPQDARLAIYARMFMDRQVEALAAEFPELAARLGDGFAPLARDYVLAHPSTHPDLGELGRALPEFLADDELARLARLERARSEVFFEEDPQPLAPGQFAPAPGAPLRLIAALRLAGVRVVWRSGFEVFDAEISASEKSALQLALQGASFAEVCAAFATPEEAFETIGSWVAEGFVSAGTPR